MKKKGFTNDQQDFLAKNWWTKSHFENVVSIYKTSTFKNVSYLSIFVQNKFMRMMKGTSLVEDSKKWQQGHIIYHF